MQPPEEEHDPAWELLRQARTTAPGPFFARNVVREVRKLDAAPAGMSAWSAWMRRAPLASGALAALVIAAISVAVHSSRPGPAVSEVAESAPAEADFDPASEVGNLEYLGQLMAVTDPSALDDAALADLLF